MKKKSTNADGKLPWSPSAARESVRTALCRYRKADDDLATTDLAEKLTVKLIENDRAFDTPEDLRAATSTHRPRELREFLKTYDGSTTKPKPEK